MAGIIEFGNRCTCESWCDGAVCWRPAQRELTRRLGAWRMRNPSPAYHVSSDAARHHGRSLSWNPRRREIWDLLAAPGSWRQIYAVGEEEIQVRQVCSNGSEETFTVEPIMRTVSIRALLPHPVAIA